MVKPQPHCSRCFNPSSLTHMWLSSFFNKWFILYLPLKFLWISGSRFKDAFQDANSYLAIEPVFEVQLQFHSHNSWWRRFLFLLHTCFCCCLLVLIINFCLVCLCFYSSQRERYMVTYNPSKGNIYALFKDQAKPDDILKATFHVSKIDFLVLWEWRI